MSLIIDERYARSPLPPKQQRELKPRVQELLARYPLDRVLFEIALQRPTLDITVTEAAPVAGRKKKSA